MGEEEDFQNTFSVPPLKTFKLGSQPIYLWIDNSFNGLKTKEHTYIITLRLLDEGVEIKYTRTFYL